LIRMPSGDDVELAYRLTRSSWGQGLATEAANTLLDYALGVVALPRIVAVTYPENRASQRVLEKLGRYNESLSARRELLKAWTREKRSGPPGCLLRLYRKLGSVCHRTGKIDLALRSRPLQDRLVETDDHARYRMVQGVLDDAGEGTKRNRPHQEP